MRFLVAFIIAVTNIILAAILIICFTPLIYALYASFFGEPAFVGDYAVFFTCFFVSYSFFTTLLLTLFGKKRKYIYLAVLLIIELLIFWGIWEVYAIFGGTIVIAWLIAQAIFLAKKKFGKKLKQPQI
jgi:hypothetical protein